MQCPTCESKLVRSKYLGANIRQCLDCNGMLLDSKRAKSIEKRINKDVELLVKEAEASDVNDAIVELRCPACRAPMDKEQIEELNFHVDECGNCDRVWFDGGELALLQLAFEIKPQRKELNRMRERIQNMTDEERAELKNELRT